MSKTRKKVKKGEVSTTQELPMEDPQVQKIITEVFQSSADGIQQKILTWVVEQFDEEYKWADELLEEVKREFQSKVNEIQLLPKTPTAKRKRTRKKPSLIQEEEPANIDREPLAVNTDANIIAYKTPPRGYRTRASSRTTTVKPTRKTKNNINKKTKFEDALTESNENLTNNTENTVKTPVLRFNKTVTSESDKILTPSLKKNDIALTKSDTLTSHIFSPPVGKPGKGHVKNKVSAYEDYIDHISPSSKLTNQSPVPDTPEQKDGDKSAGLKASLCVLSPEKCRETPEFKSPVRSPCKQRRSGIRKSSLALSKGKRSLLKSSRIHVDHSHHTDPHGTPTKKPNRLKLKKKEQVCKLENEGQAKNTDAEAEKENIQESASEEEIKTTVENNSVGDKENCDTIDSETSPVEMPQTVHDQDNQSACPSQSTSSVEIHSASADQEMRDLDRDCQSTSELEQEHQAVPESDSLSSPEVRENKQDEVSPVHEEPKSCISHEEETHSSPEPDVFYPEVTQKTEKPSMSGPVSVSNDDAVKEVKNETAAMVSDTEEDEVLLMSDDEGSDVPESKGTLDSVTHADDESEEDQKPPKASKRTKQRTLPKVKSESESDVEIQPPKRTRTKTRKLLEAMDSETKPVRQSTRTKQRKAAGNSSSVSSAAGSDQDSSQTEADSGHGSLNSNSSRTTRSKMRKPKESATAPSDDDRNFVVPENPAPKRKSRKRTIEADSDSEADGSVSKKSKTNEQQDTPISNVVVSATEETAFRMDEGTDDERNSQSEDDTPDSIRKQAKIVKPVSFTNNLSNKKTVRPTAFNNVKSFLQTDTPPKLTVKQQQEIKKKELEEKKRKEAERLQKREEEKRLKIEEARRKREERIKKVKEKREQTKREEMESKNKMLKSLEEKSKQAEDLKEEKMREEQERQKLRLKKQLEAEERRRQEEEERSRKLKEQEEIEQRNKEFLQRKKEFEEQERQKKIAEERRKYEERMAELERERIAEHERLKKIEEEKIRERHKLREEREKQLAKERAERERQEMEKRKLKDLELKLKMEKIRELEKKRMMEEERRKQEIKQREKAIHAIVHKHNTSAHVNSNNTNVVYGLPQPNLNTTQTITATMDHTKKHSNPDSYEMTPVKKFPVKISLESYDISDLRSDESTDDDDAPKKKVPSWAMGPSLKAALIQQHYHPPDLNLLFTEIVPPNLNEIFEKKKARFNKRTSSGIWNSPILKPGSLHPS